MKIYVVGLLSGLLVLVLLLVGCSESLAPVVEEAPYKIAWQGSKGISGVIYCDNYELGSSVIVEGYWEFRTGLSPGYYYEDKLLVLVAATVVIEDRR